MRTTTWEIFYKKNTLFLVIFITTILVVLFFGSSVFAQTMEYRCDTSAYYQYDFGIGIWGGNVCPAFYPAECDQWNVPGYCSKPWGWRHQIGGAAATYCAWQVCSKQADGSYECLDGFSLTDIVSNAASNDPTGWRTTGCFTSAQLATAANCEAAGGYPSGASCWQLSSPRDFTIVNQPDCNTAGGFWVAALNACFVPDINILLLDIDPGNPAAKCNSAGEEGCLVLIWAYKSVTGSRAMSMDGLHTGQRPESPTNLSRAFDPCSSWNNYLVSLSWVYVHSLPTPMQAYQISIYPAAEFSGGPYEVSYAANDGDPVTFQPPTAVMWRQWLDGSADGISKWGALVDWRVKVQDTLGLWSEWSSWASSSIPPANFTFPVNSYPWVNFVWNPPGLSPAGTAISFDSFDPTAFTFPDLPSEVFSGFYNLAWIFPATTTCVDPDPCDWSDEDPVIRFDAAGIYDVTLRITDLIGPDPNTGQIMLCSKTETISATFPLPKYREVAPIL